MTWFTKLYRQFAFHKICQGPAFYKVLLGKQQHKMKFKVVKLNYGLQ